MAATVRINEFNGASETKTDSITNTNMGSNDSVNLNTLTYPILAGDNSYEKWQKIEVTDMGGLSKIDDLKIWRTGALNGSTVHQTNVRTSSYGGAETYAQPVDTVSIIADQTMPIAEPASANLGIGGSLSGSLTAIGSSDYLVHQIQTDGADTAGATTILNYSRYETV